MLQGKPPKRPRKQRSRESHPDAERVLQGKLYRVEEVAQILQIGETEVRKLINTGDLVAARIAGSYRMTEAAIRAYVEARNDEAAEAAAIRRRERERQRELERRQQRDPAVRWKLALCVWCGVEPVLTTRNERLNGDIECDSCEQERGIASSHGEQRQLTKDVFERRVAIEVRELDDQAEEELSFAEVMQRDVQIERRVREAESTPI